MKRNLTLRKAFTFGKFLPFHRGHESLIRFGLDRYDFMSVLICCSDREKVPCPMRIKWISQTIGNDLKFEIRSFQYFEDELPNTSASSRSVSRKWSDVFRLFFPDYSTVITSEPYGDFVAEYMGIDHIAFDPIKSIFPISSSNIRSDLFTFWNYLPDPVKLDLSLKVVILGTESTGKSTMVTMLADHFKCGFVLEAAREIIENSNDFAFEDLHLVVREHNRRIIQACSGSHPLVIIDTDQHITKSYAKFLFNRTLELEVNDLFPSSRTIYLYLNNDAPYLQDGTRLNLEDRDLLDASHRRILFNDGVSVVEISGNWEERFAQAVASVDTLIQRNKSMG